MALDKTLLVENFRKINDSEYVDFEGFPETLEESGERYGEALKIYVEQITPTTTGSEIAKQAFKSSFENITLQSQNGLITLPLALQAFGIQISTSLPGYVGTPPVGLVVIADFAILGVIDQLSGEELSNLLADRIDIWIKTGVAVINGGGTPFTWS